MYLQVKFEGKVISAPAVLKHSKENWLAMNINREFMDKPEEERAELINKMYDLCQSEYAKALVEQKNVSEEPLPEPVQDTVKGSKTNGGTKRRKTEGNADEEPATT